MRILDGGERDGDAKTTRRVTRYTTHLEERLRRMEERERKRERERERERTAQPAVCVAHRVEEEEEEEVVESDTREQRPRGLVQVSGTRVCVCVCVCVNTFLTFWIAWTQDASSSSSDDDTQIWKTSSKKAKRTHERKSTLAEVLLHGEGVRNQAPENRSPPASEGLSEGYCGAYHLAADAPIDVTLPPSASGMMVGREHRRHHTWRRRARFGQQP